MTKFCADCYDIFENGTMQISSVKTNTRQNCGRKTLSFERRFFETNPAKPQPRQSSRELAIKRLAVLATAEMAQLKKPNQSGVFQYVDV